MSWKELFAEMRQWKFDADKLREAALKSKTPEGVAAAEYQRGVRVGLEVAMVAVREHLQKDQP